MIGLTGQAACMEEGQMGIRAPRDHVRVDWVTLSLLCGTLVLLHFGSRTIEAQDQQVPDLKPVAKDRVVVLGVEAHGKGSRWLADAIERRIRHVFDTNEVARRRYLIVPAKEVSATAKELGIRQKLSLEDFRLYFALGRELHADRVLCGLVRKVQGRQVITVIGLWSYQEVCFTGSAEDPPRGEISAIAQELLTDVGIECPEEGSRLPYDEDTVRKFVDLCGNTKWQAANPTRVRGLLRAVQAATGLEFTLVPPGNIKLGGPFDRTPRIGTPLVYDPESERHSPLVKIRPFLLAVTECTQNAWGTEANGGIYKVWCGPDLPIHNVNWEECTAWCSKNGLRLPSESEWEYACRAGTNSHYYFGDDGDDLLEHAWFMRNSGKRTLAFRADWSDAQRDKEKLGLQPHPVGRKRANPWGFHDFYGNVSEWCADSWCDSYRGLPEDGSARTDPAGKGKVLRGGSWQDADYSLRSSSRRVERYPLGNEEKPDDCFPLTFHGRYMQFGFRPAADLPEAGE